MYHLSNVISARTLTPTQHSLLEGHCPFAHTAGHLWELPARGVPSHCPGGWKKIKGKKKKIRQNIAESSRACCSLPLGGLGLVGGFALAGQHSGACRVCDKLGTGEG